MSSRTSFVPCDGIRIGGKISRIGSSMDHADFEPIAKPVGPSTPCRPSPAPFAAPIRYLVVAVEASAVLGALGLDACDAIGEAPT